MNRYIYIYICMLYTRICIHAFMYIFTREYIHTAVNNITQILDTRTTSIYTHIYTDMPRTSTNQITRIVCSSDVSVVLFSSRCESCWSLKKLTTNLHTKIFVHTYPYNDDQDDEVTMLMNIFLYRYVCT